jgi:hypothetical protein
VSKGQEKQECDSDSEDGKRHGDYLKLLALTLFRES